jgi:WhiB family redox-sensing transcriptional regulator
MTQARHDNGVLMPVDMNAEWRTRAECKKHDLTLWFSDEWNRQREAMTICKTCPVQNDCLSFALKYDERGIWGGKSERARRKLKQKSDVIFHGTLAGFTNELRAGLLPCDLCKNAATTNVEKRNSDLARLLFEIRSLMVA